MIRRAMVWSIGLVFACGGGSSTATDGGQATDADGLATDAQSTDTALAREITSLAFLAASNSALTADVTTTIAGTMITAEVPFGTSLSGLVATFTTSGGTVSVAGTPQVSGVTANDFTGPLVYRVSASDGSYRDYTVVVTAPRAQRMYLQASNAEASDLFGVSVSLSADGTTLAVGAYGEDSAATGIGGNQASNAASYAGAVYVFVRSGATWSQQAYVKASNTEANDDFGGRVSLSADGNTLAVAARSEASASTNQGDNSAVGAGAVYMFARSGTTWSQQAYLKASNAGAGDWFGASLDLADDGNTLAVGANYEASAATGIDGDQLDDTMPLAGAVYVFARTGTAWSQQAYVKASNTSYAGRFGDSVALDGTGNTLAVGSGGEASYTGATFIFTRVGVTWTQQAHLHASNPDACDGFGTSVALSLAGSITRADAHARSLSRLTNS